MSGRLHGGAERDGALAHLSDLVAVRGWDAAAGVYDCAEGRAVIAEWLPLVGIDAGGVRALTGLAEEVMAARGTLQVVGQASPHVGEVLEGWRRPRRASLRAARHNGAGHGDAGHGDAGHGDAGMGAARVAMFADAAARGFAGRRWRPRHYRVLVVIRVPDGAHDALTATPAQRLAETATMLGTQSRRMPPEALLALLGEMLAPRIDAAPAPLAGLEPAGAAQRPAAPAGTHPQGRLHRPDLHQPRAPER